MSYLIPQFEITASQWEAWARRAASKRPARAAHTIWRGVLELLGLGKQDVLVEETLSMQLVRLLRGAMADHPVIVAAKQRPEQHRGEARRAEIQILRGAVACRRWQPGARAAAHPQHREVPRGTPTGRRRRRSGWVFNCSPQTSGCSTGTSTGTIFPARSRQGKASTSRCRARCPRRPGRTTSSSIWSKKG